MGESITQPLTGQKLRALRLEKSMKLKELADLTGVSYSAIAQIERGEKRPLQETLAKILHGLGSNITEFYSETVAEKAEKLTAAEEEMKEFLQDPENVAFIQFAMRLKEDGFSAKALKNIKLIWDNSERG